MMTDGAGVLLVGFFFGMRHAMEGDHLAAVATLVTRSSGLRQGLRLGATWGLGHTLSLLVLGTGVLLLGGAMPERIAAMLELVVGVMLVLLGADVVRRMRARRIHFHVHDHGDGKRHFHAHAHDGSLPHAEDPHHHEHPQGLGLRALVVGMVHGMAGTAALVLLTLQTIGNFWTGMLYMAIFGAGSIVGMGVLSTIVSLPMRMASSRLGRYHAALQYGVGLFTLGYGGFIIWHMAPAVFSAAG